MKSILLILAFSWAFTAINAAAVPLTEVVESMSSDSMTSTPAIPADRPTPHSEVKKFIRRMQSTLEKAEPFLDVVEKEAKRLEHTAKQFGEGLIRSFKGMMGRLMGSDGKSGLPSIFGIIRIGGNKGNIGIATGVHTKQEEPCVNKKKMPETTTVSATKEQMVTVGVVAVENATKIELPVSATTNAPDIFADIVEDANAFDNEI